MEFNKYDLYILKYVSSYKVIAIVLMFAGVIGVIFGSYLIIFRGEWGLNIALTGASLVVLGSNYVSFCYIRLLEKYKTTVKYFIHQDKIFCPKCSYGFVINENNIKDDLLNKEDEKQLSFTIKSPFIVFLLCFLISFFLFWIIQSYLK